MSNPVSLIIVSLFLPINIEKLSDKRIGEPEDAEMPFLQHLEELRWHLVRSAIAVVLLGVVAFIFKGILFDNIIFAPMRENFPTYKFFCWMSETLRLNDALCFKDLKLDLQSIAMVSQFTMHIMASIIAGFILAFPYVFSQIWAFIKPALNENESKNARGIIFSVSFLFILGVLFGYFLVVPLSVQFLGNYQVSSLVENNITINSYVSSVSTLTLATGLLFQLPILMYILTRVGLVSPEILKKYRRHTIVLVLLLSAIITPPDITSQILVAIPIIVLYEVGIIISKRTLKRMKKKKEA